MVAAAVLFLLVVAVWPRPRSYMLDVETYGAEVTSAGLALGDWRLRPGAIVCLRLTDPPAVQAAATPECNPAAFAVGRIERTLFFGWDQGARLQIGVAGAGDLTVDLAEAPPGGVDIGLVAGDFGLASAGAADAPVLLTPRSRLVIPRSVLVASGALPLAGDVIVGDIANGGSTRLLFGGAYAVRERLFGTGALTTIRDGTLAFGDRVAFLNPDGRSAHSYASLTANLGADRGASGPNPFRMIVSTEASRGTMQVARLGNTTSLVAPRWTDRALRDPLFLGVTALLSLAAVVAALAAETRNLFLSRREPAQPQAAPDPAAPNPAGPAAP